MHDILTKINPEEYLQYLLFAILIVIVFRMLIVYLRYRFRMRKKRRALRFIRSLKNSEKTITPEQLFEIRKDHKGFTGVYIIVNNTKDLVYVGQGQDVFQRCNNHFTAKGNGDIYADYKYGDDFVIRFVSLRNSAFDSLDDLEAYFIEKCNATENGYNKKKGNA